MERRLAITDVRRRLGAILDAVQHQGEVVIIEKHGQPAATLISVALYERIVRRRDAAYQVVTDVQQQNQTVELSEDAILGLVDEAVHAARTNPDSPAA